MEIKFDTTLKELREQKKLTQSELAAILKTSQRKISYWESGKIEPDLESLWKTADFFEVSIDFLLGRNDY